MFQSTRPRGARRQYSILVSRRWIVSIHAPTRGATHTYKAGLPEAVMRFNPRAHAGRDQDFCAKIKGGVCFNPRAHAGRDFYGAKKHPF